MKNLYPLTTPPLPYLKAIIACKQSDRKTILESIESQIGIYYTNYNDNSHQLETLNPATLSNEQKEALRHCYNPAVAKMDELRVAIENFQELSNPCVSAVCQYCSLNFGPRTLDHYLPKDLFAEFSTLSLNLVPCCYDCNTLKSVAWLNNTTDREIISFYFDTLPTTQFLLASINQAGNKITTNFYLSSNSADYGTMEKTIRSHFSKLELIARYEKAAPEVISEQRTSLKSLSPLTVDELRRFLIKKIRYMIQEFSINHWKVALYQAMLNNPDFLNWCIS